MGAYPDLAQRQVTEVMSRPVFSVSTDVRLVDVLAAMLHAGVRHLAVVDQDEHCLGVVGVRTVAAVWARDPAALDRLTAGDVLGRSGALVSCDARATQAVQAMGGGDDVDAVAVVDHAGHAVGMITGTDLLAMLAPPGKESAFAFGGNDPTFASSAWDFGPDAVDPFDRV
jgi:CBS-domain-containing membrane protein